MAHPRMFEFLRPRDPWLPEDVPNLRALYRIDSSATGCTVVTPTLSNNITGTWTAGTGLVPSAIGGITHRLTDTVDGAPTPHYITSPAPTNGVRGPCTIELVVTEWSVVTGIQVEMNPAEVYWQIDFATRTVTPSAGVLPLHGRCDVHASIGGALHIRLTGKTTGAPVVRIVAQVAGANYTGDGTGYVQLFLPIGDGIRNKHLTSIPDALGISGPMTPSATDRAFKAYDLLSDTWLGEPGYPGGGCGLEWEMARNLALGAELAGTDQPVTIYAVGRRYGSGSSDTWYALSDATGTALHRLNTGTEDPKGFLSYRRDDASAATATTETGSFAVGTLAVIADRFNGTERHVSVNATAGSRVAHNVGASTFDRMNWWRLPSGNEAAGNTWALAVVDGYIPADSHHDRLMRRYLTGPVITTPPAALEEGVAAVIGITAPALAGLTWALSVDGVERATGVGSATEQLIPYTPGTGTLTGSTALITLEATVPGLGISIGINSVRVATAGPDVALVTVPTTLNVGTPAAIAGTCYPADATITVTVDGEAWGVPTAGAAGVWSITGTPTAAMIGVGVTVLATNAAASASGATNVPNPALYYTGDADAAALLMATDRLTQAIIIGDSRLVSSEMWIPASGMAVGGAELQPTIAIDAAGAWDAILVPGVSGDSTWADTILTPTLVQSFSPHAAYEASFLGGTSPATMLQRRILTSAGFVAANYGALATRFGTTSTTAKALLYTHPAGLNASSISLQLRYSASAAHESAYFGGYAASGSYVVQSVTQAGFAWGTYPEPFIELMGKASTAMTVSTSVHLPIAPWVECASIGGPVWHSWSRGGFSIAGAISDTIMPAAHWTAVVPLVGTERCLVVGLGTNNPAGDNVATFTTKLQTLIARYRAGTPFGLVLLLTSYEGQTEGAEPYYVTAAKALATAGSRIVCANTYQYLPGYAEVPSHYGDALHFNATGRASYGMAVRKILEAAAAAGSTAFWANLTGGTTTTSPAVFSKTAANGWANAGVAGPLLTGDFSVSFTSDLANAVMVGVGTDATPTTYSDQEHGLSPNAGGVCFMYQGATAGSNLGAYDTTTVWKIARVGTTVRAYKDGALVGTYANASTGDKYLMVAGYTTAKSLRITEIVGAA